MVIIESAEAMTESAANALLKTLEEPTNNSYIILLVNDEQRLLPTIISRCRHIQLKPPTGNDLLSYLNKSEQSSQKEENQDPFLNLSHLSELNDEQINQEYINFSQCFVRFLIEKNQRMSLLTLLQENKNSISWLEGTTINLIRAENRWLISLKVNGLSNDELLSFLTEHKEKLWQVYRLIKGYNKQRLTLVQLNTEYSLEKLLVDIWLIMNTVEE